LRKISPSIDPREILGTEEGIDALAKFIHKTGAFTKTGEWTEDFPASPSLDEP